MIALDSSFLIEFKVRNDIHHEQANALMKQIVSGQLWETIHHDVTYSIETVTGIFVRSKSLRLAVEYGNESLTSSNRSV